MSLVVNSNMAALNAQRHLGASNSKLSKSIERLSSGLRINSAADDAAGLAIASKLGSQVRGLNQAIRNANNAITLTQTAEGGLNTITNVLQRLRELAVQSSSDDNTQSDRATLVNEATNLTSELTRMVNTTEYNTMALLDGSFTSKSFQVGANYAQTISFTINDARATQLGGRAQFAADIADGVTNATNANFGQSEVKIDGYGVAATNAADDQYSVLAISSGQIDATSASLFSAASLLLTINGTSLDLAKAGSGMWSMNLGAGSIAALIVSAVNSAGITNVTARTYDTSKWIIEATNGTELALAASVGTGITNAQSGLSIMGLTNHGSMFGSGVSAAALTNYNGESSAIAKAAAINTIKSDSGVLGTAQANVVTGGGAINAVTLSSGDLYINGVDMGAITVTASDGTGALVSAINSAQSSTGVTADTDADGALVLTATDGRNITVTTNLQTDSQALFGDNTWEGVYFTDNAAIFRSTVQLNDDEAFALTGSLGDLYDNGATDALNIVKTTASSNSVAASSTSYNIASLSISSQSNAQAAILTIDAAIDDVNGIRAEIGAVQNRLEFTVSNLEIASENMGASQSRIMDTDFASETAIFTRNQIMVQAATAILSQANTLPQMALQLLG